MSRHVQLSTRNADVLRLFGQVAEMKERIGARIKRARLARIRDDGRSWTQGDLARALPGTVDAASVSRWESGRVRPGDDTLELIAAALEVDVSYFLAPEPANGTADLMGALNGDDTQLNRIEHKLDAALSLLQQLAGETTGEVLADLEGHEQAPPRRRPNRAA